MVETKDPNRLDLLTVYIVLVLLKAIDEKLELDKVSSPEERETSSLNHVLSHFVEGDK